MTTSWFTAFVTRGDFVLADRLLRDQRGWFAIGIRARLASLALETERSGGLFRKSYELAGSLHAENPVDVLQRCVINSYRLDDTVLRDRGADPEPWLRATSEPDMPEAARAFPLIIGSTRALALLAAGRAEEALEKYRELFALLRTIPDGSRDTGTSDEPLWHSGSACALASAGRPDEALVELEKAGRAAGTAKYPLYLALAAARLAGLHRCFGRAAEARRWEETLARSELTPEARDALARRADLIVERAEGAGPLVPL